MRNNSFAIMTQSVDGEMMATHLPFVLKESEGKKGTLYGHISAQNPQVWALENNLPALVIFSGPHAYISASWYDAPEAQVPTWNYVSVQAKGYPIVLPQTDWMSELEILVSQYEPENAWHISMAEDYANRLLSGIIYFKMEIDESVGFRKMSANKKHSEKLNIIRELQQRGEHAAAAEIEAAMKEKDV